MIAITENSLSIVIRDIEPTQRRERIINAIAASIRWNSGCENKISADDENVYELAQLLAELTNTNIIK